MAEERTWAIGVLDVPALALGTMYFGTRVDAQTAHRCLDTAAGLGASWWDTANNHAFWAGGTGDESETVLGDWFTRHGPRARDQVTVASKVGARPLPGHADLDHVAGLSAPAVRDQVTGSLGRLRTDRIPVLPVIGVSRPEQVTAAWQAVTTGLPAAAVARLEEARG